MIFPKGYAGDQCQADKYCGGCDCGEQVSPHKLGRVVAPIALARTHRLTKQVAAQIVGQRLDRRISPVRLLAHGHADDGIQIAAQSRAQALRRQSAPI